MGNAKLTFIINRGLLQGTLNSRQVRLHVASGGGGGAIRFLSDGKTRVPIKPDEPETVNNPLRTHQKANAQHRGGPLPVGTYEIGIPGPHGHLGPSAALTPLNVPGLGNRNSFYIHSTGGVGSDGCVVPLTNNEFFTLMSGLTADKGGLLTVIPFFDSATSQPVIQPRDLDAELAAFRATFSGNDR